MKPAAMLQMSMAVALLAASSAVAQVACQPDDTIPDCFDRVEKATDPPEVQAAIDQQQRDLQTKQAKGALLSKPTGVQTGGLNLRSNTTDFLPLLAMSGLLGDAKQGATQGTYVFDLNFLLPGVQKDSKLEAVLNSKPKLADAIKAQLPAASRDDLAKKLEDNLGDLSDYAFSYTFSWTDRNHGRNFKQYQNRFNALVSASLPKPGLASQLLLAKFLSDPDLKKPGVDLFALKFSEMPDKLGAAKAQEVKMRVEAAANAAADRLEQDRKAFTDAGLENFATLIDNQPQLTIAAQKNFRDPLVGGDEVSGKLTYEWGRANLNNALSNTCNDELDTPATDKIEAPKLGRCLAEFTDFTHKNQALLKDVDKFSFSAEYRNVSQEVFDLPQQGLTGLKIDAVKKVIISAGWSHLFPDPSGGDQPVRLDFVASYENVTNDPQRQDRGVATLTFTRKFGSLTVPFGIVYANHGEFLSDVNKQLSAHLGLKFDIDGQTAASGK